jgi:PIN domain nuclease of toxin-antitoxin system
VVRVVADTHALVWRLTAPRKLGRKAEQAFDAADRGRWLCCIPDIVLVEVALLRERRRIGVGPADVLAGLRGRPGYAVPALDAEQVFEFGALVGIKDPMDRLVLAAARASGGKLVSADGAFDGFGVERLWDRGARDGLTLRASGAA